MKKAMDSAKEGYATAADAAKVGLSQAQEQMGAAKSAIDEALAQQRAAEEAALYANLKIINPTDQAEVDRINAGTGPGLGIVVGNQNNLEGGEHVYRTNANIAVRMRLADGLLGASSWHKVWASSGVIRSLVYGLEIPVEVDRATSMVTGVDQKVVAEALKTRKQTR